MHSLAWLQCCSVVSLEIFWVCSDVSAPVTAQTFPRHTVNRVKP